MGGPARRAVQAGAIVIAVAPTAIGLAFYVSRSGHRVATTARTTATSVESPSASQVSASTSEGPRTTEGPTSTSGPTTATTTRPAPPAATATNPRPGGSTSSTTSLACTPSALGLIAAVSSANDEVSVFNPDGTCARPVISRVRGRPSWSPAHDRLAVVQGVNLAVVDVATGHVDVIARGGVSGAAWSPAGDRIAFSRSDSSGDHEQLLTVAVDGTDERLVADTGQVLPSDITWSPDGSQIAFSGSAQGGLATVPAGGGAPQQIAAQGRNPTWGRDGRIIFIDFASGSGHVHVINADGSGEAAVGPGTGVNGDAVTWSSDQTRMLVLQYESSSWTLVSMAPDGTDPVTVAGGVNAFAW